MTTPAKHTLTHDMANVVITFSDYGDSICVTETYKNGGWSSESMPREKAQGIYAAWRKLGAWKPSEKVRLATPRGESTFDLLNGQPSVRYIDDSFDRGDFLKELTPVGYVVDRLEFMPKDDDYKWNENPVRATFKKAA
jgi:hypothetical protein